MKKVFFVCAMVSIALFSSCAKEEIDERDKFCGDWKGTYVMSAPSVDYYETVTEEFTIQKKSGSNNEIEILQGEGSPNITATVNGNSFTYNEYTVTESVEGETVTLVINGGAQINGSVMNETGIFTLHIFGESYSGTWSSTMNKQ